VRWEMKPAFDDL